MNAFTSVRTRGADAPAKLPVQRKKAVPITYSTKRVLNVNGKLQAPLNPNAASIVIEGQAQSRAGPAQTSAAVFRHRARSKR